MYPISFIPDCLRNEVRRFHTTFEAATEDSLPEPARSADAISVVQNKLAKYIKPTVVLTSVALLGVGLLSTAVFRSPSSNEPVTFAKNGRQTLTCQNMTVSLQRGKLIPGGEGACQAANIRCTAAMMEMSQLCRDKCVSSTP
jgi:hypothetical protein